MMRASDWDPSDRYQIRDGAGNLISVRPTRGSSIETHNRGGLIRFVEHDGSAAADEWRGLAESWRGTEQALRVTAVKPGMLADARIERNRQRVWWFFRRWALHWMLWMTLLVAVGQRTDAASVAAVILVSAVAGAWSVGMARLGYLAGRGRLWR